MEKKESVLCARERGRERLTERFCSLEIDLHFLFFSLMLHACSNFGSPFLAFFLVVAWREDNMFLFCVADGVGKCC